MVPEQEEVENSGQQGTILSDEHETAAFLHLPADNLNKGKLPDQSSRSFNETVNALEA